MYISQPTQPFTGERAQLDGERDEAHLKRLFKQTMDAQPECIIPCLNCGTSSSDKSNPNWKICPNCKTAII